MAKKKSALITGITGQDGAYLARFLLNKNYNVYGTFRRLSTPNFWRLISLGIDEDINYIPADLVDISSLTESLKISDPDEVYHLAAQSYVGSSFDQPITSGEYSGLAVARILESVRQAGRQKKIRFYQASSSELYGRVEESPQNEETPFRPQSPYAAAKLYGYWITRMYRNGYDMFASNGILFNHESPLRGLEFVTRKITNAVAKIKLGLQRRLVLGNLDASRDWGYAPEYVECMWKIMQQKNPDDYVISTNEAHTVREFVEQAFSYVDLKWERYVKSDDRFYRILEVDTLRGDSSKARKRLRWRPKTKFEDLVKIMVDADLSRWESWQKGKTFSWDAINYVDEKKTLFRTRKTGRHS
jgi:GDPmannose 4,6-dehydratase